MYELSSYKLQYNWTSWAVTFGLLCTLIHNKHTGSVPPTPVLHQCYVHSITKLNSCLTQICYSRTGARVQF